MAPVRVGTLKPEDRQAVFSSAKRLGLDPYEFGALIHQESGFRPNVYGGAGGNYYGLIQFGGPERAKYLDKSKLGNYTIAEQMPAVEQFLRDRGFQPGKMGIDRAYATILGGNPNVSLTAKDSFGTSVASSIPKFKSGGSLYKAAQATLGDPLTQPAPVAAPQQMASGQRSVEEILSSALQGAAKPELNKRNSIADAMKETVLKSLLPDLSGLLNPFGFLQ
jgi:hypothetical protein